MKAKITTATAKLTGLVWTVYATDARGSRWEFVEALTEAEARRLAGRVEARGVIDFATLNWGAVEPVAGSEADTERAACAE